MDGWVDYLHVGFLGEHILLSSLRLQSLWTFLLSSVVISAVCLSERFLTVVLNKNVQPRWAQRSRLANAAWRSSVYGLVTFLRLLYMLVAMSYQLGAIAVVVVTLSVGQFATEYFDYREPDSERHVEEPLLGASAGRHRLAGPTRPRARSKPTAIFIHPNASNLARADAAALELGIAGDTELVKGNWAPHHDRQETWQHGQGRDIAREMFGDAQHRRLSDTDVFDIGDEDDMTR
ncbi:hypothetical protein BU15DRAFT_40579 [Melanogaster broomeanus]|nr:hypothetical protein BU15DRAFT_40579 [Melanogaster broomeanus]